MHKREHWDASVARPGSGGAPYPVCHELTPTVLSRVSASDTGSERSESSLESDVRCEG